MATEYLTAIQEVRGWLSQDGMDEHVYLLLDNGYDDLPSLAEATPEEEEELAAVFDSDAARAGVRALLKALREVGMEEYRADKTRFRQALAGAREENAKARPGRIAGLAREGTAVVRTSADAEAGEKRPLALADGVLTWGGDGGDSLDLAQCYLSVGTMEPHTVSVIPAASLGKPYETLELVFGSDVEASRWMEPFVVLRRGSVEEAEDDTDRSAAASSASAAPAAAAAAEPGSPNAASLPPPPMPPRASASSSSSSSAASSGAPAPPGPRRMTRSDTVAERRKRRLYSMLTEGAVFKKYKHGKGVRRAIWCTPSLDHILWGDVNKSVVKGFLRASELTECNMSGGDEKRLYLVSVGRTLELEAPTFVETKQWLEAFDYLMSAEMEAEQRRSALRADPTAREEVRQARMRHAKLLTSGEIFKKWPHAMMFHKSSSVRKLWCTPTLDSVQWGEAKTLKVKGQLLMYDVVDVQELPDPENALKFSIIAKERTLVLEAKSAPVKERWVDAVRFFIDNKGVGGESQ